MLGQSHTNAPALCLGETLVLASLEQGLRGLPPRQSKQTNSKGRQPEKVLPQAAETAVIYTHLYAATSKGDGKREAAGCRSNWSVAEIKADAMCHHLPLPASAPTDILAWKGSPGGKLSPVKGHEKPLAGQPGPAPLWGRRSSGSRSSVAPQAPWQVIRNSQEETTCSLSLHGALWVCVCPRFSSSPLGS